MIYLDHSASTPLAPEVKKAMDPFLTDIFGNPGSLYKQGRLAGEHLDAARKEVAQILSCRPDEIIFTGSGTESNNLAIFGTVAAYKQFGNHIITTEIEHKAVLVPCKELERQGFKITYLPVDKSGMIKLSDLKKALNKKTILLSIMYANNEIGVINPIREISLILKKHKKDHKFEYPFFHTDACQAGTTLPLNVKTLGVDMMTLNGSKIYGPKGVGALYKSEELSLQPIIWGGGQEFNLRSGTENMAAIVGLAKALNLAQERREKESKRLKSLRDHFINSVLNEIPSSRLNGHAQKRLAFNANFSFPGAEGEALLLYLDDQGIACSTASACSAKNLEPSYVLLALGMKAEDAHCSLRFTLGKSTTKKDLDFVVRKLKEVVGKIRSMSAVKV